jgi:hypothetical protein
MRPFSASIMSSSCFASLPVCEYKFSSHYLNNIMFYRQQFGASSERITLYITLHVTGLVLLCQHINDNYVVVIHQHQEETSKLRNKNEVQCARFQQACGWYIKHIRVCNNQRLKVMDDIKQRGLYTTAVTHVSHCNLQRPQPLYTRSQLCNVVQQGALP